MPDLKQNFSKLKMKDSTRGGGKGGTGGGYGPPYLFELFLYSTSNIFIDDD
jgi:hypothetical protein